MNYCIKMFGIHRKIFDKTTRLLLQTFAESDYFVQTHSGIPENYFAPLKLKINIIGSQKHTFRYILVDFDNLLKSSESQSDLISPSKLNVNYSPSGLHYWAVSGRLFRIIEDISPAYISGCLLEEKLEKELAYFRKFSS